MKTFGKGWRSAGGSGGGKAPRILLRQPVPEIHAMIVQFTDSVAVEIGRYNGQWAIEEFTTPHWISVQHSAIQYPF